MRVAPVALRWDLLSEGSVEQVWAILSDTDRFNRAVGLGFRFTVGTNAEGRTVRRGTVQRFGLTIRWEELPFDFERPKWFRTVRVFDGGPASELIATCRLTPEGTGTRIHYEVQLYPRNLLARALLAADARLTIHPGLDPVLREAARQATTGGTLPDPPPVISPKSEATLDQRLTDVPEPVRGWLRKVIHAAPLALGS